MDTIQQNFKKITEQARQDGARVELLISGGEDLSISFQKKKIDSFESTQSQMAGLRVILGPNQGYAYTENLSEESLLRTYKEALNNARTVHVSEKLEVPLARPQPVIAMPHLYREEEIPMDKKMEMARELEEGCFKVDARVHSVPYSGFSEVVGFKRVMNSEGLDQEFKQKYFVGHAGVLAKEGEFSKMDGEGFFARSFDEIKIDDVVRRGVENAVSRLGATKLPTGNYAVVIDKDSFSKVLQMIYSYFSAKQVAEGKSLFKGKLGQKIASDKFTLLDDPFELRGTGVRPFDDEGSPSQKTILLDGGVLKNFLTNLEYAQRLNLPHTAHAQRSPSTSLKIGPTNLVVAKGDKKLSDLLSRYDKVVHLTEFAGGLHAGFKSTTGDFSMPSEGFLYENGKKVGAIDQFVMSGNVLDLLNNIEDLSNEYSRPGSSMICPDVLIKSLSFAGA